MTPQPLATVLAQLAALGTGVPPDGAPAPDLPAVCGAFDVLAVMSGSERPC